MSGQFTYAKELVMRLSLREATDNRDADTTDATPIVYTECSYDKTKNETTYTFDMQEVFDKDNTNTENWWCRARGNPTTMEYANVTISGITGTCVVSGVSRPVLSRGLAIALFSTNATRLANPANTTTTPTKKIWTSEKTLSTRPLIEDRLGLLPVEFVEQPGCLWTIHFGEDPGAFDPVLRWNKDAARSLIRNPVVLGVLLPGLLYALSRKLLDLKAAENSEESDSTDDRSDYGPKMKQWGQLLWSANGEIPTSTDASEADNYANEIVRSWSEVNNKWFKNLCAIETSDEMEDIIYE